MANFVLLTGMPACGKTTIIKRLVNDLKELTALQGFYTEEVRSSERIGFDVLTLDGNRGILSRVG